jgi:hypothetical protein
MTVELIPFVYKGSVVRFKGDLYQVLAMPAKNARKVKAVDENGKIWQLPLTATALTVETDNTLFKPKTPDISSQIFLGSKVRLKSGQDPRTLVVIQKMPAGTIRCAVLGGDNDRFYNATVAHLELVND